LQSYNYNGIDYLIPTVVFVKKSKVSPIYQTNITSLAAGSYHTAVISSGLVYCWGYNYLGQLGVGNTTNYNTPQIVPIPGVPIAVACGWHHTAVISNGSIYCWGFNLTGQLGIGTSTEGEYTPQKVTTFIGNPIAIACGHSHTAVISDGAIYCWGSNSNGQLGNGNNTNYSTPQRVTISGTPTAIACGADHTAAISNGSVYCWGKNFSGQLGTGNTTDKNTPQLVTIPFNGFIVTAVACGSDHTAAIAGGYIFCWGYNGYGQLGLGNNTRYTTPQIVPIPGTVIGTSIACGDSHTASISNGAIYCWGLNNNGQLGIGNTTSYNTPRKVTIPGIPLIVSCGLDYTTAISGGSVYCWGYNGYGQFGNGDNYSYYTPKLSLVTL
jgi:alpha-tubulin suppressor-like RCC1 family protein